MEEFAIINSVVGFIPVEHKALVEFGIAEGWHKYIIGAFSGGMLMWIYYKLKRSK